MRYYHVLFFIGILVSLIPIIGVPFHVIKIVTLISGSVLMILAAMRRQSHLVPIFAARSSKVVPSKKRRKKNKVDVDAGPPGETPQRIEFEDDDVILVTESYQDDFNTQQ